ncbi:MAG TPA: FadR/GntR family transcriptional regulator [Candidatus Aquilonibacter sp.]|nr:FadR/GntR family transcriptional regulator [Candidatus Aquilonibacter sp.]
MLNSNFESVRRRKVYEETASQIEQLILKGRPGDRLPPEREMAGRLGVSRGSVRDAIRRLDTLGIVESRQGVGTIIRKSSADFKGQISVASQSEELLQDLFDVRNILEVPLVERAVTNMSADQVAELQMLVDQQEEKHSNGEMAIAEDDEFHSQIALSSGNNVLVQLIKDTLGLLRTIRERSLSMPAYGQQLLDDHRRILAAIKRRNPEVARGAMRSHLKTELAQVSATECRFSRKYN